MFAFVGISYMLHWTHTFLCLEKTISVDIKKKDVKWALFNFIEPRSLFSAKTPETWATLRSWHVLVPRALSSFPWHLVANPLDLTSLLFVFLHSVIYLLVMRSETLSGDSDNQPTFRVAENMPFPPRDCAVLRLSGCWFFFFFFLPG